MVNKYIKNCLAILVLLFACTVSAQTEVKNKIVDFLMQTPIESASIYVQNTTIGTVSNADGRFSLLVPQEFAKDTLIISSIGYKSYKTPVDEFDNSFDYFAGELLTGNKTAGIWTFIQLYNVVESS